MPKPVSERIKQKAREELHGPPKPVNVSEHNRAAEQPMAFENVNWRAALLAAGGLLVAVARRDYASAFDSLLLLAEAFGIRFQRAEMSYTDQAGERRTVGTHAAGLTEPKTLEQRIDAAANVE